MIQFYQIKIQNKTQFGYYNNACEHFLILNKYLEIMGLVKVWCYIY